MYRNFLYKVGKRRCASRRFHRYTKSLFCGKALRERKDRGRCCLRWVREFESKSLSLSEELSELETQVYMSRNRSTEKKEHALRDDGPGETLGGESLSPQGPVVFRALQRGPQRSPEDRTRTLWHRPAKKSWRGAVDNLRLRHPDESLGSLSGLFGKSREGYYSVSREKRLRKELSETEVVSTVKEIRTQAPGIGAYKLFVMLRELYPDEMRGRDWFYRLMHGTILC